MQKEEVVLNPPGMGNIFKNILVKGQKYNLAWIEFDLLEEKCID